MAKTKPPEAVSRLARWAVLLFLAYAFWQSTFGHPSAPSGPQNADTSPPQAARTDCPSTNPLSNFSLLALPLLPTQLPVLNITDNREGSGPSAVCGQTATLRYEYATREGDSLLNAMAGAPVHARIGAGTLLHGLELGLVGMKPGGERHLIMPPEFAFAGSDARRLQDRKRLARTPDELQNTVVAATADLLALAPPLPISPMPLRIVTGHFGSGGRTECGDRVRANISVWKLDGTPLFTTAGQAPLAFTLGDSGLPYGIEQGMIGMSPGGERTLILPPAFSRPLDPPQGAAPPIPTLPADQAVLVEVVLVPDETPGDAAADKPVTASSPPLTPAPTQPYAKSPAAP